MSEKWREIHIDLSIASELIISCQLPSVVIALGLLLMVVVGVVASLIQFVAVDVLYPHNSHSTTVTAGNLDVRTSS